MENYTQQQDDELTRTLEELDEENDDYDFDYENQRVCAVAVGKNKIVSIEELLMQLGMAETVAISLATYSELADDKRENAIPPSDWAVSGMYSAFTGLSHALLCLMHGHKNAYSR